MTALTGPRATHELREAKLRSLPVKGGYKIFQGGLVVLAAGLARPGYAAAGNVCVGVAEETVDAISAADSALSVKVRRGTFKFVNNAADEILAADVGATAYVLDDQTVTKTAAGHSAAGVVYQVDSDGVWVTI